jgi:aminoglycoside 6'-N-acetyltransferase
MRLCIEPLTLADLDSFVAYRQNPDIARYQSWETSYSMDQAKELLSSQAGILIPDTAEWLQLAVREREGNELLGDLALHTMNSTQDSFELGFTISPTQQGKGYAKEAATILMDELISKVGAKKFVANTDSRNVASIALLSGLGFQHIPSKSWTEDFKNEIVTVHHFELIASS